MIDELSEVIRNEVLKAFNEAMVTEHQLYFDRLFFGISMHRVVNGKKIRLNPLTHYIKDDIIFCKYPNKCETCTEPIQLEPNNILK